MVADIDKLILIIGSVFMSRDFELDINLTCEESTFRPRTGLILFYVAIC